MREDEIDDILSAYKKRIASAGGKARAKKLTPAQLSEAGRKAVQTRWAKAKKAKKKAKKKA